MLEILITVAQKVNKKKQQYQKSLTDVETQMLILHWFLQYFLAFEQFKGNSKTKTAAQPKT